jgi:DNA-binding SARP family transcriptional activator
MDSDDHFLRLPEALDSPSAEAWRQFIAAPGRSRELAAKAYATRARTLTNGWAGLCFAYHLTRGAEVDSAQDTLNEVRELFATIDHERGADIAEVLQAYLDIVRGLPEQAVARLERIATAQATSAHVAPLDRFLVYHALGLAYSRLGQLERVLQHHYTNVAMLEGCGAQAALAVVLHNLSGVLGAIDDWPEAHAAAQGAVRCCESMDNAILMRRARINLALALRFLGRVGEALAILGRLRPETMREPGSDFALFINSAEALAVEGVLDEAATCLARAREFASPTDAHQQANCEWIAGFIASKSGQVPGAITHLEKAQQAVLGLKQIHVPILPRIVEQLAGCYAQSGDHERAFTTYRRFHEVFEARLGYTTRARTFGQQSRHGVLSIESLLRKERGGKAPPVDELGDRARMNEALRRALATAHAEGEGASPGWTARSIARVRAEALGLGIDDERLGGLVANLHRASAPTSAESPPALQVCVLGRFEIRLAGEPMRFGRKAPTRPLALLKYLASCGTREPAETEVADALWPDQDGDAALRSLAVNLHRLRRLLGSAATVAHHERRLALDAREVGCDAFAFERLLDQSSMAADVGERHRLAAQALELYRGEFLSGEDTESWILPVRERLRARFVKACAAQGAFLASTGRMDEARMFYARGLEADGTVEELCLGVMRCSLAMNQPVQGIAAYRDLERTLARRGRARPAAAIETLYGELLRHST